MEAPLEEQEPGLPEHGSPARGNALHPPIRRTRRAIVASKDRVITSDQERIWEQAAAFCVRRLPTLWTAGEPRCNPEAPGTWIVPIVLRYPEGHEGVLGEMAFDEQRQDFTLLTERAVLSERAREIAASHPAHDSIPTTPPAGA